MSQVLQKESLLYLNSNKIDIYVEEKPLQNKHIMYYLMVCFCISLYCCGHLDFFSPQFSQLFFDT